MSRKKVQSVDAKRGIGIKAYSNTFNRASLLQLKSILEIKTTVMLPPITTFTTFYGLIVGLLHQIVFLDQIVVILYKIQYPRAESSRNS